MGRKNRDRRPSRAERKAAKATEYRGSKPRVKPDKDELDELRLEPGFFLVKRGSAFGVARVSGQRSILVTITQAAEGYGEPRVERHTLDSWSANLPGAWELVDKLD